MRVPRGGDAPAVEFARFVEFPQFFERLPTMVVSGCIRRVRCEHGFAFRDGARPFTSVDVFHSQTVTGKFARWVGSQDLFEELDARSHLSVRIPLVGFFFVGFTSWLVRSLNRCGGSTRGDGIPLHGCLWATPG